MATKEMRVADLLIADIDTRTNYRGAMNGDGLQELADSIKRNGLINPVIVRPAGAGYQCISGHRRIAALRVLGEKTVRASVRDVDESEARVLAIVDNLMREDVHPMDEAEAIAALLAGGMTQDQVAATIAKSQAYVSRRLVLVNLSEAGREAYRTGKVGPLTALALASIASDDQKAALAQAKGLAGKMSDGQIRAHVLNEFARLIVEAPFNANKADSSLDVPACAACPKNTNQRRELFDDVASGSKTARCTDGACWKRRTSAAWDQAVAVAKADGLRVLTKAENAVVFPSYSTGTMPYGNEFIRPGDVVYEVSDRPIQNLFGPEKPADVLGRMTNGGPVWLWVRKDAVALARKLGLAKGSPAARRTNEEKAQRRKAMIDTLVRREILKRAGRANAVTIARAALDAANHRIVQEVHLAMIGPIPKGLDREGMSNAIADIAANGYDAQDVVAAVALASSLAGWRPALDLGAVAKEVGVDLKAARARAEEATRPKAEKRQAKKAGKAKAAPAKRKARAARKGKAGR